MSFISYLKEVRAEVVHVSWPTRETLIQHTTLVIGISVALGLALGAIDGQFGKVIEKIATHQIAK